MPLPLTVLLQIADSAFPTGAFAYSSGLEALARAGRFSALSDLEAYLDAHLRQAADFDLAFVAAAHAAEDAAEFAELCLEWDATFWNHGMRAASLRQGRALLDALEATFAHHGHGALAALNRRADRREEDLHFAPALGHALGVLGASREQACCLYLHGLIRDQAAAAVRLGITGPRAAQALQARAMRHAMDRLGDGTSLPLPRDARRSAPLVETGQGGHGFLYSRLFQN